MGVSEGWTNDGIGNKEVGLGRYDHDRAVEGKVDDVLLYVRNAPRARQVEWKKINFLRRLGVKLNVTTLTTVNCLSEFVRIHRRIMFMSKVLTRK